MPTKIFLAHASEDKPQVREIHARLKSRGLHPWLDEVDLIPGQNWQVEIQKAIRASDIFAACLSQRSVNKSGYVQKEFRAALNTYAEKPPDAVYLIPLKLTECDIPDLQLPQFGVSLRDIQWLDYWRPDGFERLMIAIDAAKRGTDQARSEAASPPPADTSGPGPDLDEAENVAIQWFSAMMDQDLDTLVALSAKPFYDGDGEGALLLSDADLRVRYRQDKAKDPLRFSHLKAGTVADWKRINVLTGKERVFAAVRVAETDVVVICRTAPDWSKSGLPEEAIKKIKEIPQVFRGIPLRFLMRTTRSEAKVRGYWGFD
jgi:hypothetical protein